YGVSDSSFGTATGQVTLDRVDLTYAPSAVPGVTGSSTRYEAETAELGGGATTASSQTGYTGTGYVSAPASSTTSFAVEANADGYYTLGLRYATSAAATSNGFRLTLDGTAAKTVAATPTQCTCWNQTTDRVYLHAGINVVAYTTTGAATAKID